MEKNNYAFDNRHMQNIKAHFENKTGVQLSKKRRVSTKRKVAIAMLASVLCLTAATPVLAANVPEVYELMYLVSPSVAQYFKPVQKSAEYDGIKMEVVSAYIHGNTAEVYITMQDLTGDRLDETTDLYDSYSIHRPFDSVAHCTNVGYDDTSKTATFLVSITEWDSKDITGDKITFSVREFMSNVNKNFDYSIQIDMQSIGGAAATQMVVSSGGGGDAYPVDSDNIEALIPSAPMPELTIVGLDLTGIGYINGQLHIQIANNNPLENGNNSHIYLKDSKGDIVENDYSFNFTTQHEDDTQRKDYCEFVFDIPKDDINDYSVFGNFYITGPLTKGFWSVTFPLEQAK